MSNQNITTSVTSRFAWNIFKLTSNMREVEEVDKNAEFRSDILPHLPRFVVVYIILRNLYLVLFVSQKIQQVDNLSENFLFEAKLLANSPFHD